MPNFDNLAAAAVTPGGITSGVADLVRSIMAARQNTADTQYKMQQGNIQNTQFMAQQDRLERAMQAKMGARSGKDPLLEILGLSVGATPEHQYPASSLQAMGGEDWAPGAYNQEIMNRALGMQEAYRKLGGQIQTPDQQKYGAGFTGFAPTGGGVQTPAAGETMLQKYQRALSMANTPEEKAIIERTWQTMQAGGRVMPPTGGR